MLRQMFCLLALIIVALSGCSDGGAEVSKKQLALLGELRDTLTKVKDGATLKSELPKLEEITKQLAAAQAEFTKQQISTEQQRDLRANYGKNLESLLDELEKLSDKIDTLPNIDEKDRDQFAAAITMAKTGKLPQ